MSAEVLRTGRPVRIEEYSELPGSLAAAAREHGFCRFAGAPIIVDGRVWGLVSTSSPDAPLPDDLEDRLAEFTELVATAIAFCFQAEDGIRVRDVTGVQTCALPICRGATRRAGIPVSARVPPVCAGGCCDPSRRESGGRCGAGCVRLRDPPTASVPRRGPARRRSEERRVGKECRRGVGQERSAERAE